MCCIYILTICAVLYLGPLTRWVIYQKYNVIKYVDLLDPFRINVSRGDSSRKENNGQVNCIADLHMINTLYGYIKLYHFTPPDFKLNIES